MVRLYIGVPSKDSASILFWTAHECDGMNLVREHHIAIWHRAQNAITHIWTNCSRRHLRAQTHSRLTWFTICLIITPQNCRIAEFTFAFDAIYFSRHELRVWETLHEWCILYPEIRQMDDNDSNWLTCLIFFNFFLFSMLFYRKQLP